MQCKNLLSDNVWLYKHFIVKIKKIFSFYYTSNMRKMQDIKKFEKFAKKYLTIVENLVIIVKVGERNERKCGCSSMARIPAFQAGRVGSIPITRSTISNVRL